MDKNQVEQIQKLKIADENWDSSMFEYMTNEQIVKCLHFTIRKLLQNIVKFHEDISRGIELRILTDEEFIQRIEKKVEKG